MPFKNKDLLVNLLPQGAINAADIAKICLFRTNICRFPTFCFHRTCLQWGSCVCRCTRLSTITQCGNCSITIPQCGHCSFAITFPGGGGGCNFGNSCGAGGSACDPTDFCFASEPFVIEDLEDLVSLRGELRETLARLDQIEKEGLESGIQTRADADAMEKQLTEQLEYVRRRREGLK